MKRYEYPIKQNPNQNWNDVFNDPKPIVMNCFETGKVVIPKSGALNPKHSKSNNIQDEFIEVPIFAYLIQHENLGNFLIDTGLDTSYQHSPYGKMRGILVKKFQGKSFQDKGQDIFSRIQKMNIPIKAVFFTHLHPDHTAGTLDLSKDIKYVVGKNEPYLNIKFLFYGNHLQGIEKLYEINFSNANNMHLLGQCADIFGDGSLWAISTPGHTKSHMSFLINGKECPILITGDACLLKIGLDNGIGPGTFSSSIKDGQKSLDRIVKFTKKFPNVNIFYGHDDINNHVNSPPPGPQ